MFRLRACLALVQLKALVLRAKKVKNVLANPSLGRKQGGGVEIELLCLLRLLRMLLRKVGLLRMLRKVGMLRMLRMLRQEGRMLLLLADPRRPSTPL